MGSIFLRKIKGIKLGQTIITKDYENSGEANQWVTKTRKYIVTEIYPYIVKTRRRLENRMETRCFSIGELVQLGYMEKGGRWL